MQRMRAGAFVQLLQVKVLIENLNFFGGGQFVTLNLNAWLARRSKTVKYYNKNVLSVFV